MLKKLKISNFAIIENIELDFENHLTVITGETGSGKSILLGAINLLLGERADYSVIRDSGSKTIVEGHWQITHELMDFFESNDLDFDTDCFVRREILKEGKSRAFVNDTPVTLQLLKSLTERLIHIHSQHNTLELREKSFQLSLLDVLGDHSQLLQNYQAQYKEYTSVLKEHNRLSDLLAQSIRERDYNQFQKDELELLNLATTNYDALQTELEALENRGSILENLSKSIDILDNPEGVLSQLKYVKQLTQKSATHSHRLQAIAQRLASSEIELKDIQAELQDFSESLNADPNEIERLNMALEAYQRMLRKHHVSSQEELQKCYQDFLEKTLASDNLEEAISSLTSERNKLQNELELLGSQLSDARKQAAESVCMRLQPYFEKLKLSGARVVFKFEKKEHFDASGMDQVDLLFSTNTGFEPKPVEKIASGGELGRLMLILMTLLSEKKALPTVIFDEVDTGVSGDVADRIGQLLREMGTNRQLFAITHLPQVASAGHQHVSVRKVVTDSRTSSKVIYLNSEERKLEIAQLLSGEEISEAAIANAKQLLNQYD